MKPLTDAEKNELADASLQGLLEDESKGTLDAGGQRLLEEWRAMVATLDRLTQKAREIEAHTA